MRRILLLCLVSVPIMAKAQSDYWAVDTIRTREANYFMDKYHDLLRYHDPIMYLAYPYIQNTRERKVPLQEGEGKNGNLLEGQLTYRFVIQQGKYYSSSAFQRARLTLDVGMLLRLTNDYSQPLLPMNAKFGLGLDFLLSSLDRLKAEKSRLVWLTVQLHHYSNGQSDSFFLDNPIQRNNYKSGDFSTNYIRGVLNVAVNSEHRNTITTSLGYQNELNLGGPLVLDDQLRGYYGLRRLLFGVQWTQKPQPASVVRQNRGTPDDDDVITLTKHRQVMVKAEMEYILDDVSKFIGDNPQRWGAHAYITYMPSITNEVGFMAHAFYGRDYLNIRFDDVVFIGELGVYAKFNRR